MKIKLAGFNVEKELLDSVREEDKIKLTPETFSAAYARISRSKLNVTKLREKAREDIKKSRISNKKIIFSMGHHSVAEHAVFNFDIIEVSRLALEYIEKSRLSSYTEKSQRYVTLKGDFLIPREIKNSDLKKEFINIVSEQNDFYLSVFGKLKEKLFSQYPELLSNSSDKAMVTGWAKEDARYILSLATLGQVGLTINARNLEQLFRRFSLINNWEIRQIRSALFDEVKSIAPSILLFREPSQFEKDLREFDIEINESENMEKISGFRIVDHTNDGDDLILASFICEKKATEMEKALLYVKNLSRKKKIELFIKLFSNMEFFDSPPRNFELPEITFEATVSASNFAQLKRHRMATLLSGEYDPVLGNTIPDSISQIGMSSDFLKLIEKTNSLYYKLHEKYGNIADYILTNSHRRNVLMKMNLREIFHFIRLRSDNHAQWDIKNLSNNILKEVKKLYPLSTILLCGKDNFINEFKKIYKKDPDFLI